MVAPPRSDPDPDFETIAPLAVAPGRPASPPPPPSATGVPARGVIAGAALLLGLGALLLWALSRPPAPLAPLAPAPPSVAEPASATAPAIVPVATPAPWDDPEALQARQRAQTLAQSLQQRREALLAQGVEAWAAKPFAEAEASTARAAEAFEQRRFAGAAETYAQADAALAALQAEVPERRERALAAVVAALDDTDAVAAQAALAAARPLAAEDPRLPELEARLAALPAVSEALANAALAERESDWTAATQAYQAALAADGASPTAREGLARVQARQQAQRFQQALGEALAALDAGQLAAAESALSRAAALRSDDPGLREAQRRLRSLNNEAALRASLQAAEAAAAAEDWEAAVRAYEAALQRDPSRVSAQQGLARARPRAELAAALEAVRAHPEGLAAASQRERTAALLARARAVTTPGPRLRAQIDAVDRLLRLASTPVPVRLVSDNQTTVTVYRVGEQGRFSERELALLPGRYVAVGARAGYQDVRVEFEVRAGEPTRVQVQTEVPL